jgi:vacuolar-type H+-ATPase subunit C/Vma6
MTAPALVARARGLSTHLLDDDQLAAVDRAGDRAALVGALANAGFAPVTLGGGDPHAIERAIRARDREERALIDAWAIDEPDAAAVLDDDDDRRTLRIAIRGVVAGASSAARLAGAVATRALPEPALAALAAAASPAELAAELERRAHPAAAALAPLLAAQHVDLLAIELALSRWFGERARGRAGDEALARHVAQRIDVDNLVAALLLAARGRELDPAPHFQTGGALLDRARFTAAATAAASASAELLAPRFAGTPLAEALAPDAVLRPDAIEHAALRWQLETQADLRRREPLGLAPLLWLVVRRRLERVRLRRAAWRVAMRGQP